MQCNLSISDLEPSFGAVDQDNIVPEVGQVNRQNLYSGRSDRFGFVNIARTSPANEKIVTRM